MKKVALILGAVVLATGAFAQKANIKKAKDELRMEPVNYEKAISYIELAKQNPETAELSDTWYQAGRIGYDMAYNEKEKVYLQQANFDIMGKGLDMMFTNYMVANNYDSYLDKKGRVKYYNRKTMVGDLKEMFIWYYNLGEYNAYEVKDYNMAYTLLNEYLQISDSEMFGKKSIKVDSTYNKAKYLAAFCARHAEKVDEAIRLFEELKSVKNENTAYVFQNLADMYVAQGDTAKAEATLEESVAMFPTDKEVIGSLVNHYMKVGKSEKAVENLDKLVNSDPSNVQYKIVKANVLAINLKDFATAKTTLQELFDNGLANNNSSILLEMGQIWMLEGYEIGRKADDTEDNDEYNKLKSEYIKCFETALGYFKDARENISNTDQNYQFLLQCIREMYVRLGKTSSDEYKAVNEEIKSLGF